MQRRYHERYPRRHTYIALLCGGVWTPAFVFTVPLQKALVPEGTDILFPLYVLVALLRIAVALMALLEGAKAAQRKSRRKYR